LFSALLIPEISVGIVIVTMAVATRQSSCGSGVNLKAGGAVFVSPHWFFLAAALVSLIVTAMASASIT